MGREGAAMRVAILSDIHGNLVALEAVLADLAAQGGADALVIAGDLCLDGPRPREVLAHVRALGCAVVQGNTDRDLALPPAQTAARADAALLAWTRAQIGDEGVAYLSALPFAHRIPAPTGAGVLLVVHANPKDLDQHLPPFAPESQIAPLLADLPPEVTTLAFGHLHLPYVRDLGRVRLIDIASVGLPKDGDRRAGYGLLTWAGERWSAEQRRVEYPVEETVAQLRAAAPPGMDELLRTLLRARYPNMVQARGGRETKRRPSGPRVAASAHGAAPPPVAASLAAQEPPAPPARPTPAPPPAAPREQPTTPARPARRTRKVATAAQDPPGLTPTAAPATAMSQEPPGGLTPNTAAISGVSVAEQVRDAAAATRTHDPGPSAAAVPPNSGEPAVAPAEPVAPEDTTIAKNDEVIAVAKKKHDAVTVAAQETPGSDASEAPAAGEKQGRKAAKRARLARETALLRADEPFALALPLLLEGRLAALLGQIAAVRGDDDPKALHALRVATRHLRAALDAAAPFFAAKAQKRATKQVRRLAEGVGKVRDADVLLDYLRAKYMQGPDSERAGLETVIDALSAERAEARDDLDPLLDRWAGADEDDPGTPEIRRALMKLKPRRKAGAQALTGRVAADALATAIVRFEKRGARFADGAADPAVAHALRIAAKKLRYTVELFAPLLASDTAEQIAELKDLQDTLGALHDRDVLADLLAWERAQALERQLHLLEQAVFIPGSREERVQAVRAQLNAPESFTATAPGIYGLLIDVLAERDALEARARERWTAPQRGELARRLRAASAALAPPEEAAAALAAPNAEATHG